MPRDIAGRGYSRMPFVQYQDLGTRGHQGSSDRVWKQYIFIYIKYFRDVFLVGGWCIFSMHPNPEMNRRSNGTAFEVRTSCPDVLQTSHNGVKLYGSAEDFSRHRARLHRTKWDRSMPVCILFRPFFCACRYKSSSNGEIFYILST